MFKNKIMLSVVTVGILMSGCNNSEKTVSKDKNVIYEKNVNHQTISKNENVKVNKEDVNVIVKNNIKKVLSAQKSKSDIRKMDYLKDGTYILNVNIYNKDKDIEGVVTMFAFNKGNILVPFNRYLAVLSKDGMLEDDKIIEYIQDSQNENSKLEKIKKDKKNKKIAKLLNPSEDKGIFLDSGKEKTMVVFTDPHCPFCYRDLNNIDEHLKNYNVYIILTPLTNLDKKGNFIRKPLSRKNRNGSLHPMSADASANILHEIAGLKTNEEKIKVLKKHFSPKQKLQEKTYTKEDLDQIKSNVKKYEKNGLVQGTPTMLIVDTKKLFKDYKPKKETK